MIFSVISENFNRYMTEQKTHLNAENTLGVDSAGPGTSPDGPCCRLGLRVSE